MKRIAFFICLAIVSVCVITGCKPAEQTPAPEASTNAPAAPAGTNAPAK